MKLTTFPVLFDNRKSLYAVCILLAGCSTIPETVEVKVPVVTFIPCKTDIKKPVSCTPPDNTRVEWLRCSLVDSERNQAYIRELEAALQICSE